MMQRPVLEDFTVKEIINPPLDTQYDEETHADDTSLLANIRSKVYPLPKLWYLRVNVMEARDLFSGDKSQLPKVYVTAILQNQTSKTRLSRDGSNNPTWNEDLMFVAEEPFNEPLILNVEQVGEPNIDELLGTCSIPLQSVDMRLEDEPVNKRWVDLEKHVIIEGEKFNGTILVRICLEGGYHVHYESTQFSSDLRPSKQLWEPSIGVLKLKILSAINMSPMKKKDWPAERMDAYCVVKYGQKWVRTRTVLDNLAPKWNEQYTWEVFDACTVVTVGVFNNCHLRGGEKYIRDSIMGMVRIRLSSLQTNRLYTHSYPLVVLHPTGVKRLGEIQLAIEFNCSSFLKMMYMYSQSLLPKMHYTHPLTPNHHDNLRHQARRVISMRLSQVESPLRKEVVEYMLHVDSKSWSLRKSKANFLRVWTPLSLLFVSVKLIRNWENPRATLVIHVLFLILVLYPRLIFPGIFLCLSLIGIWNFRWRPRHPPQIDLRLSCADNPHPDELDEEFDAFPTARPLGILRMRYDRLRSIAGRLMTVAGDCATLGERLQSLLNWRDPRATALFTIYCLILAILIYLKPFEVVIFAGFYVLRHPWLRSKHPSVPINFFKRLPGGTDNFLQREWDTQ